jgi:predicted helicase
MNDLEIHADHPRLKTYFEEIRKISASPENAKNIAPAFARLLKYFAKQVRWTFIEHFPVICAGRIQIVSGAFLDNYNLVQGIWINLPDDTDLDKSIKGMINSGLPVRNALFQYADRLMLWRKGKKMIDTHFNSEEEGVSILLTFLKSPLKNYSNLENLSDRLEQEGPAVVNTWAERIRQEQEDNSRFKGGIDSFKRSVQNHMFPDYSRGVLDRMIVKYLLVRRLTDKIFKRSSFITSSSISGDIEKVLARSAGLRTPPDLIAGLEPIVRHVATHLQDHDEKLIFLESLLRKFFPHKDTKGAVLNYKKSSEKIFSRFIVDSVEFLLQNEFAVSISDEDVNILNPFAGDGSYICQLLKNINHKQLNRKYCHDLYGNEIRMIPYYLSLINIESEYLQLTGKYVSFPGLSVVDTFLLSRDSGLSLYSDENSRKIERQRKIPFTVILGETPAGTNDIYGKKGRGVYPQLDKRVFHTYASASAARNKTVISDTYVKAIRWASDKIAESEKGIAALVCKNNFIDDLAFDGLRKHLIKDFNSVFVLDIYKKEMPGYHHHYREDKAVLILIKNDQISKSGIYHQRLDWDSFQKTVYQEDIDLFNRIHWRRINPDKHHTWLTEGLQKDYEALMPMGTKIAKAGKENAIFRIYGRGVATSRDAWVYNFKRENLSGNVQELIQSYNKHVQTWGQIPSKPDIDEYLGDKKTSIPWSDSLKNYMQRQIMIRFKSVNIREALYRPFTCKYLYFDQHLIERWYQLPHILPAAVSEKENRLICVSSPGSKNISFFMTAMIPDLNLFAGASPIQCFPLYHYDRDGRNRRENISDWALQNFIDKYKDQRITKYDIFHYVYAILHHPAYIRKYAANLKKQLPRIPFIRNFQEIAEAGKNLARLHVFYEGQEEYPLKKSVSFAENPDWQIEKMILSKDRRNIKINDSLTLSNIPARAFEYIVGHRSALEWVIEQYRLRDLLKNDNVDDPNKAADPTYIIRLICQVITVSLESIKVIQAMPPMDEILD